MRNLKQTKKWWVLVGLTAALGIGSFGPQAALRHRYPFDVDARDVIGGADGTLMGMTFIENGGVVMLGYEGDYVELPPDLITGYNALTIEFWAEFGDNGNWSRVFDFGDQREDELGRYYVFFSPHSGAGDYRMSIAVGDPGYTEEYVVTGPGVLDNKGLVHVACVYDPSRQYMGLFVNGRLVNERTDVPASLEQIQNVHSWLGRSLYSADAWLNGTIYELRIYDEALTPFQIAVSYASGMDNPNTEPGTLQSINLKVTPSTALVGSILDYEVTGDYSQVQGVPIPNDEVELESSDTNVVAMEDGTLRAVAPGIATITVRYQGMEASQIVEVISVTPELRHRWSFNETPGETTAHDSIGGADGQLWNDAYFGGDGKLYLDGLMGYVDLPNGLISTMTNITIEIWTTWNDTGLWWQRIIDFGSSDAGEGIQGNGVSWLFLTTRGGWPGELRFSVLSPSFGECILDSPFGEPPSDEEFYVAIVYNYTAREAKLYLNGKLIAKAEANIPLSEINDINNWLGASQFAADAYYKGSYNELRIWEGALSDTDIAIHAAAGPDLVPTEIGEPTSLTIQPPGTITQGQEVQLKVLADYPNLQGVDVSVLPTLTLTSSDPSIVLALPGGKIQGVGVGTATITANFKGVTAEIPVTVQPASGVPYPPVLVHRYTFDGTGTTVTDVVGGADGTAMNGAQLNGDGKLVLDGQDDYVDLPNGIISALTNATFEAWVIWHGPSGQNWSRIFDFGNSDAGEDQQGTGTTYLFLTPHASSGKMRFSISVEGPGAPEQYSDAPSALPLDELVHVVLVYDSLNGVARLYLNGERVAEGPVTISLTQLDDVNNWLGRSQFFDPYFNGEYYEFRIWNGVMTDDLIAASDAAGPDALPGEGPAPKLSVQLTQDGVVLSWPKSATGWTLESTPVLGPNAQWTPVQVQPSQVGENFQVTIRPTEAAQFFRLKK